MATVLVVDDEPAIVDVLAELVNDIGHISLTAYNGHDALLLARQHRPQMIISDVMMPPLDGYALVEALRSDLQFADTIIILMSAVSMHNKTRSDVMYMSKPFDLVIIESLLQKLSGAAL